MRTREWVRANCRLAQMQQTLQLDPEAAFSDEPAEHPELLEGLREYKPLEAQPEEWFDGFWHVTTNLPGVLSWGALKSRRQLGGEAAGLGGGWKNEAAGKVSLTHNWGKALQIYEGLQYAAKVAKGGVSPSRILYDVMSHMGVEDDAIVLGGKIRGFLSHYVPDEVMRDEDMEGLDEALDRNPDLGSPAERYSFMIGVEDAALAWEQEGEQEYPSARVGFTAPFEAFSRVDPANVAILRMKVRKGAPHEEVPQEMELRYDPDDVQISGVAMRAG